MALPEFNENPVKEFGNALADRFNAPVTGVYALSWLAWNWRIPMIVIFGTLQGKDRIEAIESLLYPSHFKTFGQLFLPPIVPTLFLLFLIPIVREKYAFWLARVEYRTARSRIQVQEDLSEVREYRMTLQAMNAFLVQEMKIAALVLKNLGDASVELEDTDATGISTTSKINVKEVAESLALYLSQIREFGRTYTGDLPTRYKYFLFKWGKKS